MSNKAVYYLEVLFGVLSMLCVVFGLIFAMLCVIRGDMRFSWIAATCAISALVFILMKIYLFND